MNVISLGTDIVECARIRDVWQRHGDSFTDRILTPAELEYVRQYTADIVPRLAGRFAAKEAILKVLGTGWRGKIAWRDMEILNDALGRPAVTLRDECARIAAELGIISVLISISHTENYATAVALGLGR